MYTYSFNLKLTFSNIFTNLSLFKLASFNRESKKKKDEDNRNDKEEGA